MRQANRFGYRAGVSLTAAFGFALAASADGALAQTAAPQPSSHELPIPPRQEWSFSGPFGRFDQAQLQRGFQVYREVCSTCHSLKLVAFHNLADPGGPHFLEAQVKALAATYKIKDGPNEA